jgi:hypothetical protein
MTDWMELEVLSKQGDRSLIAWSSDSAEHTSAKLSCMGDVRSLLRDRPIRDMQ